MLESAAIDTVPCVHAGMVTDTLVVMVDVDHFKRINDTHSHLLGDAVLRQLARLLRARWRDGDLALRFGAEEFVLLLGDATPAGAWAVAERARAGVEAHDWSTLASGVSVTACFGVAHATEATTGAELLAIADRRLCGQGGRPQSGDRRGVELSRWLRPLCRAGRQAHRSRQRRGRTRPP